MSGGNEHLVGTDKDREIGHYSSLDDAEKQMLELGFKQDKYGFIKQLNPQPFAYDMKYKKQQSTNVEMSWLRLGFLAAHVPYKELKEMTAVDIGSGNGSFVKESARVFKEVKPYDLDGDSISEADLYSTQWDIIIMSDVLEHYHNIDDLWALNFTYALISFPERPHWQDLKLDEWRHYKPNEHVYCLDSRNFEKWVQVNGYAVDAHGHPEDQLRDRWNPELANISTFLIRKHNG